MWREEGGRREREEGGGGCGERGEEGEGERMGVEREEGRADINV